MSFMALHLFTVVLLLVVVPTLSKEERNESDHTTHPPQIMIINDKKFHQRWMERNPDSVHGQKLFETDMMFTPEQWEALRATRKGLNFLEYSLYKWPPGDDGCPLIPVTFRSSISAASEIVIRKALHYLESHTCIKFKDATVEEQKGSHIFFKKDTGCWSYIGRVDLTNRNITGQPISIGNGCSYLHIIIHEVGHSLGLFHEQARTDRNRYVRINYDNIADGYEGNFNYYTSTVIDPKGVDYDPLSIMHYGAWFFSNNGRFTIATYDTRFQGVIGTGREMTHRDKLLINRMYNCTGKWLDACNMIDDPCENEGYTGPNCTCICPRGTSSPTCTSTSNISYYDAIIEDECWEEYDESDLPISIESPNDTETCSYDIQAPHCHLVRLNFTEFQMFRRSPDCKVNRTGPIYASCCYFETLIVGSANNNYYDGDPYCDKDLVPGSIILSTSDAMVLHFKKYINAGGKFSANVDFVPNPACHTTTTTTTTTPTPTGSPDCLQEKQSLCQQWTSPNHPGDYPTKFNCEFDSSQFNTSARCSVSINMFNVVSPDRVRISYPYSNWKDLNGSDFIHPQCDFKMDFDSDDADTASGFNITVCKLSSKCHKNIDVTGSGGKVSSPGKGPTPEYCEWRFKAPENKRVSITMTAKNAKKHCADNYVLVNTKGDHTYPKASTATKKFCKTKKKAKKFKSVKRDLSVLMVNKHSGKARVKITYKVL